MLRLASRSTRLALPATRSRMAQRLMSTASTEDEEAEAIGYMSDSHDMLRTMCRDFADAQLVPVAGELDKEHRFPAEQIAQSASRARTNFPPRAARPTCAVFSLPLKFCFFRSPAPSAPRWQWASSV